MNREQAISRYGEKVVGLATDYYESDFGKVFFEEDCFDEFDVPLSEKQQIEYLDRAQNYLGLDGNIPKPSLGHILKTNIQNRNDAESIKKRELELAAIKKFQEDEKIISSYIDRFIIKVTQDIQNNRKEIGCKIPNIYQFRPLTWSKDSFGEFYLLTKLKENLIFVRSQDEFQLFVLF